MRRVVVSVLISVCAGYPGFLHAGGDARNSFALSLFSGGTPGGDRIDLAFIDPNPQTNPSFAFGLGMSFGGIALSDAVRLHLSSEISYTRVQTDDSHEQFGETVPAQYTYTGMPVLIWAELHQTGKLGPFVKVGAGAVRSTIDEDYPDYREFNFSTDFWSFAYAVGGGIRYCPTNNLDLLLEIESIVGTESGTATNSFGQTTESESPYGFSLLGLRIRYWFNPPA
jgi:opacity protein-like surface antigen